MFWIGILLIIIILILAPRILEFIFAMILFAIICAVAVPAYNEYMAVADEVRAQEQVIKEAYQQSEKESTNEDD